MAAYEHILAGVDLSDEADQILAKAADLAVTSNAKLTLLHVVEPLTFAYGGDIPVDLTQIQEQLQTQAEEKLGQLAQNLSIPNVEGQVLIGQPVAEIHDYAEDNGVDLVVIGSHGRQGLALLLGSTANGVLHGAKCDVLAVRVKE